MYLHIDSQDYSDARVGFAVSETPAGPYRYLGSERPLGYQSRDIGVFQDHDGSGYLLSEDRERGLHIYRLSDDYLQVSHLVCTTVTPEGVHGYESPALVRVADTYYLFGSDLTGWACNDNKVAMSRSLAGPWSAWLDIAPPGSATFESQVSTVLTVTRPRGTALVYVGDRWLPDDLGNSPAVWLPLRVDDAGHASLEWRVEWSLADLSTLVTRPAPNTS
jgi:hypothetical protein